MLVEDNWEEIQNKVHQKFIEWELEMESHNKELISSFGETAEEDFLDLLECCDITDKIKVVDGPESGKPQKDRYGNFDEYGVFKEVHIDQWSTGPEGDSFSGFIYTKAKNKWLKIPYSC